MRRADQYFTTQPIKKEPTCILYPRSKIQILIVESKREKYLVDKIEKLYKSPIMERHRKLTKELEEVKASKLRFVCQKCGKKEKIKDLVLYRFISYSDGPDEWRYEKDNIICLRCGRYHYLDDKHDYRYSFKDLKEIHE